MERLVRRAGWLVAAFVLLAAQPGTPQATAPFEIDAITSTTGPSAFVGVGTQQALAAVESIVNKAGGIGGRPLRFVVHDDQSDPRQTVQIADELIAKHPTVILGSTFGAGCRAIFPLSTNGPVIYCMTPAVVPAPGSFNFSAGVANKDLSRAAIRYFRLRGWTKLATITATDATGQDNDQAIDDILALPENKSVHLVDREHFSISDLTVDAQLTRVKSSGANVLFIGTAGTPTGTIMRSINEIGLSVPVGINYGNATRAQMTQLAKYLPAELYFFGTAFLAPDQVTDPGTKRAVQQYYSSLSALGVRGDASQVAGFDTASLVAYAFSKLGTTGVSPERLRTYLAGLKGWVGVNGPYDFQTYPQRGLGPAAAVISRWNPEKQSWDAVSKPGGEPLSGR